jgi:IMP dehydrogenase/GMP reductase
MIFEESLGFESIAIKQKKNKCLSRLDANTESEIIKGVIIKIPLIAANMSSVIDSNFYNKIMSLGAFAFLHRAKSIEGRCQDVMRVRNECEWIATSIGIGNEEYENAKTLILVGANIILIDIAHGYCDPVIELGRKLKKDFPHIKMVVGNTVNVGMMDEVMDFADALKVGVGQGLACDTKSTAGCTEKQFSAVLKFKSRAKHLGIPIISDGGLREPADFIKSIGAGANSAMAGSVFAACEDSPSEITCNSQPYGGPKKIYAGMASEYVQNQWKGGLKPGTCAEGSVKYLDIGKPVDKMLEMWQGALRTGISYAGGVDIRSFQETVEFIRLS